MAVPRYPSAHLRERDLANRRIAMATRLRARERAASSRRLGAALGSCILVCLASGAALGAGSRRTGRIVRGLEGDANLLLDAGRSRRVLRGRFLGDGAREPRPRLSAVEKLRLGARRIYFGSRLADQAKVLRLIDLVRAHLPDDEARYVALSSTLMARDGRAALSS